MEPVGITTTVPGEILWAAGIQPVDLNNLFITAPDRNRYLRAAEREGYPRNVCAWVKGMYGVLAEQTAIQRVVAVVQGDCSNTSALMETLRPKGIETIPFAYPYNREPEALAREMATFATALGTTMDVAEAMRTRIEPVRRLLDRLDDLTWRENRVTGGENHLWLVSSSDFNGDIDRFARELGTFIGEAERRDPAPTEVRLAYLGVPPVFDDLYEVIESQGARVVFNEVQRQFSLPERTGNLVDNYLAYTYPYDIFHRLEYIGREIERRAVRGAVHYVQSFCHRHIQDLIIRRTLQVPVLTIEGENPGAVDERTKIRIQAFVEMLGGR